MAWKSSFGGHALLDAVDDRELGGALLLGLEQALRLVEQARVLERGPQRGGDGAEQAHVGLAVRVLALVVLDADHPEHAVAADDRHRDHRLALVGAWNRGVPMLAAVFTTCGCRVRVIVSNRPPGTGGRGAMFSRFPCS